MDPVPIFLTVVAAIFIVGIVGEMVFERTGIPDALWLLLVGALLGPVLGVAPREQLQQIAPAFGAFTLVIVLFQGGSALRWADVRRSAGRSLLLAVLGFVVSAAVVASLSMVAARAGLLPADWTWIKAATLGTILGGASSVVVMPSLRIGKVSADLESLIGVESALTDVLCIVGTQSLLRIQVEEGAGWAVAWGELARTSAIGLGIGAAAGALSVGVLRRLSRDTHAFPITLAALLLLYAIIDSLGGSAALGILAAAVIVGNAQVVSEAVGFSEPGFLGTRIRGFHQQITFLVKSFFFTFMGAMIGPPWGLVALGLFLAPCLLLARGPVAWAVTRGMPDTARARRTVWVCLPRGMAAGVLASFPVLAGVPGTAELPSLVFATVAGTILVFAVGFRLVRRADDGAAPDGAEETAADAAVSAPTPVAPTEASPPK